MKRSVMMKDGGAVVPNYGPYKIWDGETGLTIRQFYKAAVLIGIAAHLDKYWDSEMAAVETARFADAMIAEDEAHAKGGGE
ncbi:MAG: hypothetical protein WC455_26565 [Dehalococcoidia bacterium]|jgi:hypothetical protein